MPQFGHVAITDPAPNVVVDVVIGVLAIRHLASHRCGDAAHTVRDIDPGEPSKILSLVAFEWTQADPQSCCSNDVALSNI